jgi:hypothetical protein
LLEWQIRLKERVLWKVGFSSMSESRAVSEPLTVPNVCRGRPIYRNKLFLSLVRKDVGRLARSDRKSKVGSPASARFISSPDMAVSIISIQRAGPFFSLDLTRHQRYQRILVCAQTLDGITVEHDLRAKIDWSDTAFRSQDRSTDSFLQHQKLHNRESSMSEFMQ